MSLDLHYSVNGGPEKTVPLLKSKGTKSTEGQTCFRSKISKWCPVTWSACTPKRGMRVRKSSSDLLFLEAQPFEREYQQSQTAGGGGGGGEGEDDEVTSARKRSSPPPSTRFATGSRKSHPKRRTQVPRRLQGKLRDQSLPRWPAA